MKKPWVEILNLTVNKVPKAKVNKACNLVFSYLKNNAKVKSSLKDQTAFLRPDVRIVFLSRERARGLNHQFRKRDYATDVLSFESESIKTEGLGEIALCLPVLKSQAKEHGVSFQDEVVYLVIHGILHLLGYDHEKGGQKAVKMMKLQDKLFGLAQKE